MNIDYTVERLEKNYQNGYKHVDSKGHHWKPLPAEEIVEALDNAIARHAINDPSVFLTLTYQIVAHQTYHAPVDDKAQMTYYAISQMLEAGEGNPRIHKLENVLNALGASLVVCRIEDRENDVPYEELPRACFFQHLVRKERWPFRSTIELLFQYGLQFRIFSVDDSQKLNTLTHAFEFVMTDSNDEKKRTVKKSATDIVELLQLFNVESVVRLELRAPDQK